MKIYIQTETHTEAGLETRPRMLVMETAAPADKAAQMLGAVSQMLGAITAIPAIAHEAGLKAILPRDLAAHDITATRETDVAGAVTLKIIRTPNIQGPAGQADVTGLAYRVELAE
jgi:hypothetical protein